MLRSLHTAASGMKSQQFYLDTISNNLSNVNTAGFKKNAVNFQDLLYQQLRPATEMKPTGIHVGTGVRVAGTAIDFQQGPLLQTENSLDVAIEGKGFFQIELPSGQTGYTRNGNFSQDQEGYIVNTDGYRVLDDGGSHMQLPSGTKEIQIMENGNILATIEGSNTHDDVGTFGLVTFSNPSGVEKMGGNIYLATSSSGEPIEGVAGEEGFGLIRQSFLEGSNVTVVDEMVKMITAQRSYEISSKAIQTSDEMLGMANNLRR